MKIYLIYMKKKVIRITTVPISLGSLLKGQLKYISQYFDVIGISSSDNGTLKEVAKNEELSKVFPVKMTRKITPLTDLMALLKLYRIFKKEKPFIVHSHTPKAGTLSMIAAKLAGVPHRLHTIAGLPLVEVKGLKRMVLNSVERITYSCSTMIYPNSYGLVDIILENNFTKKTKLKILANGSSNGIDTSRFNPELYNEYFKKDFRTKLNLVENDYVFIYVGRLVKDKGVNELIKAFGEIEDKHENVKLLVVGGQDGTLDPLNDSTLEIIKTNKNIISTGYVRDVRPYFSISDCMVFPSYREGFPNVVLQAAAMGLPCIVSNINGSNEVIEHKNNGFIIPVKDDKAIYSEMAYVLNHKEDALHMGLKSRSKIILKYEQQIVWGAILKEYNSLK